MNAGRAVLADRGQTSDPGNSPSGAIPPWQEARLPGRAPRSLMRTARCWRIPKPSQRPWKTTRSGQSSWRALKGDLGIDTAQQPYSRDSVSLRGRAGVGWRGASGIPACRRSKPPLTQVRRAAALGLAAWPLLVALVDLGYRRAGHGPPPGPDRALRRAASPPAT